MKKLILISTLVVMLSNTTLADTIWEATVRGDKAAVQKFLDRGVSIEAIMNGGTPLWYAASYAGAKKEEMVRFIVSKGGNLNAKYEGKKIDNGQGMSASNDWTTILHHFATKNNSYNIFKLLLELGADPDILDWEGKTPLFYVKEIRHVDVLLNNGANIDYSQNSSYTPLLYHTLRRQSDVIPMHLIIKGANIAFTMTNGSNLLHIAAAENHAGIVEYLINKKYDLEQLTIYGESPLILAIKRGSNDVAYKLILSGVNLGPNENTTKLPLLEACGRIENNRNIIDLLLLKGVSINQKNIFGTSALHVLAHKSEDNDEAFSYLQKFVAEGAEINAVSSKIDEIGTGDSSGTPLDVAEPGTRGYDLLLKSGGLTRVGLVDKRITDLEEKVDQLSTGPTNPTDEWPRKMWEIDLGEPISGFACYVGINKSIVLSANNGDDHWITQDGKSFKIKNTSIHEDNLLYLDNKNLIYKDHIKIMMLSRNKGLVAYNETITENIIFPESTNNEDNTPIGVSSFGAKITAWDYTPPTNSAPKPDDGNGGGNGGGNETVNSRLIIKTAGPDIALATDGELGGAAELQKSNDLRSWRKLVDVPEEASEVLVTPRERGNEFYRLKKN